MVSIVFKPNSSFSKTEMSALTESEKTFLRNKGTKNTIQSEVEEAYSPISKLLMVRMRQQVPKEPNSVEKQANRMLHKLHRDSMAANSKNKVGRESMKVSSKTSSSKSGSLFSDYVY